MIFYFTGTGNTRWVARQIASTTGEELHFIPDELRSTDQPLRYTLKDGERLGFCFPTHGWQPPRIVRDFIRRAVFDTEASTYVYAVTTCGDNMGHAMRILQKELAKRHLQVDAEWAVVMPESNVCFPFLHLDTPEGERQKIERAKPLVAAICRQVTERRRGIRQLVRGAIPYTYTYVIGGFYNKHLITDGKFWVDADACIQCGLCQRLCPVDDITATPPQWSHDGSCTNCLACYHHCPRHAIHWGSMKRGQYTFKD